MPLTAAFTILSYTVSFAIPYYLFLVCNWCIVTPCPQCRRVGTNLCPRPAVAVASPSRGCLHGPHGELHLSVPSLLLSYLLHAAPTARVHHEVPAERVKKNMLRGGVLLHAQKKYNLLRQLCVSWQHLMLAAVFLRKKEKPMSNVFLF